MPRTPSLPERVTVAAALRSAAARLDGRVDSPKVDAELLLSHVLGASRTELHLGSEKVLTEVDLRSFEEFVARRVASEPLQYIIGTQDFRGIQLLVGPGVLVPRPETEMVVERALERISSMDSPTVVDLGAGSGAIAIAIALERKDAKLLATEISSDAVAWCRKNLEATGAKNVRLYQGDLFDPIPPPLHGHIDLVVSNPPYLSDREIASAPGDVRDHEPRVATVAGATGLEVAQRIVEASPVWLRLGGWLVLETHPGQSRRLSSLMRERFSDVEIMPDLAGLDRIAEGRLSP